MVILFMGTAIYNGSLRIPGFYYKEVLISSPSYLFVITSEINTA